MPDATVSRRDFLKTSAVTLGAGSAILAASERVYAAGSDTIRVGLIGCGGRGTGAARDLVTGAEGIEIVAMGDLVPDRLARSRQQLAERIAPQLKVTDATAHSGFDAYQRVIESDVHMVIMATPPQFRPAQLKAAIEAGRHVFMEKPVAVDPVGIRSVIASAELAAQRNLGIVAGTQRRHDPMYIAMMQRIHDGALGDVIGGQVYWNQGGLWKFDRTPGMSDMEWQIRNWLYFTWLSGDHIVEQHIHNIDVANWALGGHPVRANGVGGRQVRVDPAYGHIFDHFCVELEYANGAHVLSMCRQQDGTARHVGEQFQGARGSAASTDRTAEIMGSAAWTWQAPDDRVNPYVQEHTDLIASIRAGKPLNEGRQVAESTLSAILAREAAYTGRSITWDEIMASDLDLTPGPMQFGPIAIPPVPQPGVTKLERTVFLHAVETGF
jgi:predicted dehydrogenase